MPSPPLLVVTGPTASGKSALALHLAEKHDGELISADSRQVYRLLDIGTAKPSPDELARVPHHFIDALALDADFSAGRFAEAAWARIDAIRTRGRTPIVVGGSTLYVRALTEGLADVPAIAPDVRADIERRREAEGNEALFAELQRVDPTQAATMDATKSQRLVRALEVYHGTGRPLSYYHEHQPRPPHAFRVVVLAPEREKLYARINQRVDEMLAAGLLDEVRGVLKTGCSPEANPLRTIGYQEPIAYLRGEIDYDEMVRLLKRNSRRYAKRQLTYYKRYPNWLDPADFTSLDELAEAAWASRDA